MDDGEDVFLLFKLVLNNTPVAICTEFYNLKALLHCAIFCATCLAIQLHESLPNVTYLATTKNIVRPVAETVAEK